MALGKVGGMVALLMGAQLGDVPRGSLGEGQGRDLRECVALDAERSLGFLKRGKHAAERDERRAPAADNLHGAVAGVP